MHLYELFACLALILMHLCALLCIFFYRFVVSIKNSDLDSKYVNVGLIDQREVPRILNGASEFLEGGEAGLSHTQCPRLLDRF